MGATEIDIAVACGYVQHQEWWSEVWPNIIHEIQRGDILLGETWTSSSALPDVGKNRQTGAWCNEGRRQQLTDANRNLLVGIDLQGNKLPEGFMGSRAEWVFWVDDDTVPPKGAIRKLLDLKREMVAGVYFLGGEPHNPLAYVKTENGFYRAVYNYAKGTLTRVDSVGMGCTLIHKDVYRKIIEGHEIFQRPNASLMPIHKSKIDMRDLTYTTDQELGDYMNLEGIVQPNPYRATKEKKPWMMTTFLTKPSPDDNRTWPFYALEYNRTEDHHFCELAANVGVQIYVDTTITCKHWKTKAVTEETYLEHMNEHYQT